MNASTPKIAHVDAESGFSGGEVQVFLLIEGLQRLGWRNVLFSPPGSQAEARAAELGIEHVAVPMRNDLDGSAVLGLRRGFRDSAVDLVHLHTGRATWLGGWAARLVGLPAITTRRMDRDVTRGVRSKLVYETLTRRVVAISDGVADCLRRAGVPEDRIRTIRSSVDAERLRPSRSREEVRHEHDIGPSQILLLFVGALVERKGVDVLLEALARSRHMRREWDLWIAGEGAERAALERRSDELGLAPNVYFLGQRDDVPDLLAACDLFVMPSRREGLGVAALEAMVAHRAVIASRVGGLAQVVEHEHTGLLVPPEDPDALAAAIDHLISDGKVREWFGREGARRIAEGFDAGRMVAEYAELYREVLAEAPG